MNSEPLQAAKLDKDHLDIYIYTDNVPLLTVNTKLIPPIDGDLGGWIQETREI